MEECIVGANQFGFLGGDWEAGIVEGSDQCAVGGN
jgi:hypothetical protein